MGSSRTWLGLGSGIVVTALGVAAVGGIGYASPGVGADIPDGDGEIKLCFDSGDANTKDGGALLSIYNPGKNGKKCAPGDRTLSIDRKGEKGSKGERGARGTRGKREAGPSRIPVSGYAIEAIDPVKDEEFNAYFPSGVVNGTSTAFARAPFAFTITDFRVVVPEASENARSYAVAAASPPASQVVLVCTIEAGETACTADGSLNVAKSAIYAFGLDPEGSLAPLPAGSQFSYVIER